MNIKKFFKGTEFTSPLEEIDWLTTHFPIWYVIVAFPLLLLLTPIYAGVAIAAWMKGIGLKEVHKIWKNGRYN